MTTEAIQLTEQQTLFARWLAATKPDPWRPHLTLEARLKVLGQEPIAQAQNQRQLAKIINIHYVTLQRWKKKDPVKDLAHNLWWDFMILRRKQAEAALLQHKHEEKARFEREQLKQELDKIWEIESAIPTIKELWNPRYWLYLDNIFPFYGYDIYKRRYHFKRKRRYQVWPEGVSYTQPPCRNKPRHSNNLFKQLGGIRAMQRQGRLLKYTLQSGEEKAIQRELNRSARRTREVQKKRERKQPAIAS